MTLRNTEYGGSADCEVDGCDHPRGARLESIRHYGCVLCVWHEDLYQTGEISLPDTADRARSIKAQEIVLGP